MARHVDGLIVPAPRDERAAYRRFACGAAEVWRGHGAPEVVQCVADGVQPGRLTSFPQGVRLKADEVVVFARAGFESRAHRERVNKAAMADPRLADMTDPVSMPLGAGRVVLGGFESIVWSVAAP